MAAAIATAGAVLWGWLWNERFWLPANVTWADLERESAGDEEVYPRAAHVLGAFPMAVVLLALRRVFERVLYWGIIDFKMTSLKSDSAKM